MFSIFNLLQEELLPYLLNIATATVAPKVQLLASKLLLYYTQTPEVCLVFFQVLLKLK